MADPHSDPTRAKSELRRQVLAARRTRSEDDRSAAAEAIARHALCWPPIAAIQPAEWVAAYLSFDSEPGTAPLLDALRLRGAQILVPVVLTSGDLDWAAYDGQATLRSTPRGPLEPSGTHLSPEAITTAKVVIVPGFAVSTSGDRLGRGGGSYDRALVRVADQTPIAVVVHDDEVGLAVPTEQHDRAVTHALCPRGILSLRRQPPDEA